MTKQNLIDNVTTAINNAVSNTGTLTPEEIELATYEAYAYLKTVNPNLPNRPK